MTLDLALLIVAAALILAVFVACLFYKESMQKDKVIQDLKNLYQENGYSTCCSCGKMYEPLNDPEYWPELNICRDCLWKLCYEKTFEKEEIDV